MINVYRFCFVDYNVQEKNNSFQLYCEFRNDGCKYLNCSEEERIKDLRKIYLAERRMVKELFKNAGWEGDGKLMLMWLPPFLNIGVEDSWGVLIWYVKQFNNGISFIGIDDSIEFPKDMFRFNC